MFLWVLGRRKWARKEFFLSEGCAATKGCMSVKLVVAVATVCGAPTMLHAGERAVLAEIAPAAPFDAAQLVAAIRLRVPAGGAAIRVRVSTISGGVQVVARGNARDIALGGRTGVAAARLVALVLDDLLLDDLATLPTGLASAPEHGEHGEHARGRPSIGVLGSAAGWQYPFGGLGIDVALPSGHWLLAAEASGGTLIGAPLQLAAAVIRISGGLRAGPLELRGGATLVPVLVDDGAQDQTLLAGAGASVRLRVPIAGTMRAVLAGGIDAFATRTTYLRDGMAVLVTPRIAPWIAAGVEITP